MKKVREYGERLADFELSKSTKTQYLAYYRMLFKVVGEAIELDDEIANAFLRDHPNSVVMAMLNDYANWKKLNITFDKRVVKRKRQKEKRYISPAKIKKLSRWMKENTQEKYWIMLNLTYYCALRRKETVGISSKYLIPDLLEWKKDQKRPMRLTISKASAKGSKEGIVIVPPKLAKALFKYVKRNQEDIKSRDAKNDIFGIQKDTWQKYFSKSAKKCLGVAYHLHELRFSRATYWHKQGFDIFKIKKLLRHADIKTTQLYIDPERESVLKELEDFYINNGG